MSSKWNGRATTKLVLKHREQSQATKGKAGFCKKVEGFGFFSDYTKYLDGSTWQLPAEGAQKLMLIMCDANYTFREGSQQGQGAWVAQAAEHCCDEVSVMKQLQPDLEGSHQSLHFIYVLHATS